MSLFRAGVGFAERFTGCLAAPGRWLAPSGADCLWCGRRNNGGSGAPLERHLCEGCRNAVPWIASVVCAYCGRYEACEDCRRRSPEGRMVNRSAVRYDPFMKELLARYKYRGSERLAPLFGEMIGNAYRLLRSELAAERRELLPTIVTYIPLSGRRLQERGFNQAARMAEVIARSERLALLPLLVRTRHTEKQSYKSRRERLDSLLGAFDTDEDGLRLMESRFAGGPCNIVIVDDVYTTGSTLYQGGEVLSAALRESGRFRGLRVYGMTWAR